MFTKEFIIEAAIQRNLEEDANCLLSKMRVLGIINNDVTEKCKTIINNAKDFNKKAIEYMYSFLPQELKEQLRPIRVTGAYATNITGKASFSAEITLHRLKNSSITLKFDNNNKCLYYEHWHGADCNDLLAQYLENNANFDTWMRE